MQIDIPNDDYQRLALNASAAGYPDVAAYVVALSGTPPLDPRGDLSHDELAASVAQLRESFADEAAGRTHDLRDALQSIAERHGLPFDR